jgi:accessory gene regulator B
MKNVENVAESIAYWINHKNPESSSIAVLRYALIALINQAIIVCIVLIITLITGDLLKGLLGITVMPILRHYSGGMHFKSNQICNIVTAIIILLSIYFPISYWYNGFILNIISLVILMIYAPSGIKKSKLPKSKYPRLKWISILIVGSNLLFNSPMIAILFFIQSLTTITGFQAILDRRNI